MPATPPLTEPTAGPVESPPPTMRAVVSSRYGSADVLEVHDGIPVPRPGSGEVLVKVEAAGLSRAALHLLTGTPYLLRLAGFGLRAPKQPVIGIELSGTVAAVGDGVARLKVGDPVFGYGGGTFAEWSVAKGDKLALRPSVMTAIDAAAIVDSASTALQAVRDHAEVQTGQRVLVIGASGGVGSFAVQIAKGLGATVTATAGTAKLEFVRSLGADHVIDHRTADPLAEERGYDVIIDIGGNNPVRRLRRTLATDGTLVIVGGEGGGSITGGFQRQLLAPIRGLFGNQRLRTFVAKEHHDSLDALAALVEAGTLRAPIDRTHQLADAATAVRRMEAGEICGKDVIAVASGA